MLIKSISIITIFIFLWVPIAAKAQESESPTTKITSISEGEPAPYTGILFDLESAVKLKLDKKYSKMSHDLNLKFQLDKLKAEYDLKLDTLQIKHDTLKDKSQSLISLKEEEIDRLQDLIKKNPNDHTHWWFAGGVIAGVLLSIGIFYAAVETSSK
jgi:hypothetical protein